MTLRVEKLQANQNLVGPDGRMTEVTLQAMEKLVSEVIALRTAVDDHEARIVVLEP